MKSERLRAIVLRRTNYGEADRILQLLTPEGRRSVIARGVRREKSKLAGGIELFAVSDVVIGTGRGELGILTSARLVQFYRHIVEDYDKMQFGYEVITLVARASETVDEPEWFAMTLETLMGLNATSIATTLTEAWFYVRYSVLLGHELGLQYDIHGAPLEPKLRYQYDVANRGFVASEKGEITAEHIKLLRLIATKSLQTLAQIGGIDKVLPLCAQTARAHAAI